ncbi:pro-MCH 2 [Carassius auratus]|uniref:Pro-MCH n=1 Tax=Carassius auratus TaxID=7957 RepID=A0A6P6LXW2_CARAU|nr:pro-MCH [Carassius auratus]BCN86744.1 Pro-melanin-concentrating hormone 2a [Carassius auratus]
MASSYIFFFALALLVELTTALPKVKMDEGPIYQDRLVSIVGEDDSSEMGPGQLTFKRHPIIEGRLVDEDGTKRIFILADTGIKGSLGKEANLAFSRTFTVPRGTDHALDGFNMRDERRSIDDVIPVGRRDIDMLRCMIGRVYRPCWQA